MGSAADAKQMKAVMIAIEDLLEDVPVVKVLHCQTCQDVAQSRQSKSLEHLETVASKFTESGRAVQVKVPGEDGQPSTSRSLMSFNLSCPST